MRDVCPLFAKKDKTKNAFRDEKRFFNLVAKQISRLVRQYEFEVVFLVR